MRKFFLLALLTGFAFCQSPAPAAKLQNATWVKLWVMKQLIILMLKRVPGIFAAFKKKEKKSPVKSETGHRQKNSTGNGNWTVGIRIPAVVYYHQALCKCRWQHQACCRTSGHYQQSPERIIFAWLQFQPVIMKKLFLAICLLPVLSFTNAFTDRKYQFPSMIITAPRQLQQPSTVAGR